MGWCSGTHVFDSILDTLLNDDKIDKETIIKTLINSFEDADWDCQSDSEYYDHPLVKKCFEEIHPSWFEDDYDDEYEQPH